MLAQGRSDLVDVGPQRGVVAHIRKLEFEQTGRPHPQVAVRRLRDAEVFAEHVEGDGPDEAVHHLEPPAGIGHNPLRRVLHGRGKTRRDIAGPDDLPHGLRIGAILGRVAHAEEERLSAHDDVELRPVGHPERVIVEEDFAHMVVARRDNGVAEVRNRPDRPQHPEGERETLQGPCRQRLLEPAGAGPQHLARGQGAHRAAR